RPGRWQPRHDRAQARAARGRRRPRRHAEPVDRSHGRDRIGAGSSGDRRALRPRGRRSRAASADALGRSQSARDRTDGDPAAQTPDLDRIVTRMLRITRLTATALLPLLPPTLLLAPVLLPGILGQDWKPMVVPFQILVCVGIGHAILVPLGDSLSGIGVISWR